MNRWLSTRSCSSTSTTIVTTEPGGSHSPQRGRFSVPMPGPSTPSAALRAAYRSYQAGSPVNSSWGTAVAPRPRCTAVSEGRKLDRDWLSGSTVPGADRRGNPTPLNYRRVRASRAEGPVECDRNRAEATPRPAARVAIQHHRSAHSHPEFGPAERKRNVTVTVRAPTARYSATTLTDTLESCLKA